jgi:hypothetical protein
MSTLIATAACESDYREVAEKVSKMTGLSISHTTAWSVTQSVGERVREREKVQASKAKKNEVIGQIESKILIEEQDGIWLNLQGKDRYSLVVIPGIDR